ncbi:MAG: family 20 glycosylhydrolase [Fimbriimonadaceae bacterium]
MIAVAFTLSVLSLPPLVPKPFVYEIREGAFNPALGTKVTGEKSSFAYKVVQSCVGARPTGANRVQLTLDESRDDLGQEGYTLEVKPDLIEIKAHQTQGLTYGAITLRQLWGKAKIPCLHIEDKPRFEWRGMHLDVSRHFYPTSFVKKYIDLLAEFKMNVFHWHLVDDGGWRVEIKKYPKLTEIGAWREGVQKGWDYINLKFADPKGSTPTYGGFYSQNEVKEVVAYATERGVTVVPEIEMPGHTLPALWCYPEIRCTENALESWKLSTGMFGSNVYCAGKESSFEFIENVLDEVLELFPSDFIHVGGDEVDKRLWTDCTDCQRRIADEKLKDNLELQSYFIRRIEKFLNSRGRRMVGWDEILEGGLAPNATVMSWRGISGGIQAAKSGHDVVMSPTSHCYFDYGYNNISTETVYGYNPIPDELASDEGKHVLGAQGNVWTEWMDDSRRVEKMAFPRAIALAEVLWSSDADRSWTEFQPRLAFGLNRLDLMDVQYNIPEPTAALDACIFETEAEVAFEKPMVAGSVIRFTTDGSEPTATSPIYTNPIKVTSTTVVKAVMASGKNLSDPVVVNYVKAGDPPKGQAPITAKVFLGKFSKVADFAALTPAKSETVKDFGIAVAGVDEGFGITFEGTVTVPVAGTYTIALTSDDGSVLSIGGATTINHDGLHGGSTKTARVKLPAGIFPFRLDYFEAGGAEKLEVSNTGPAPLVWGIGRFR